MRELYPDTIRTRSLHRYEMCGYRHCVEPINDFTDRIVSRRDYCFLVIGVRDNISRIHVILHDLIGSEQESHGSDAGIPILVRFDLGERDFTR